MRRNKTHQRGRVRLLPKFQVRLILALVACGVAYLIVGSRTVALRSADLSAAETVALRFPENWDNAPAVPRVLVAAIGTAHAVDDAAVGFVQSGADDAAGKSAARCNAALDAE